MAIIIYISKLFFQIKKFQAIAEIKVFADGSKKFVLSASPTLSKRGKRGKFDLCSSIRAKDQARTQTFGWGGGKILKSWTKI